MFLRDHTDEELIEELERRGRVEILGVTCMFSDTLPREYLEEASVPYLFRDLGDQIRKDFGPEFTRWGTNHGYREVSISIPILVSGSQA